VLPISYRSPVPLKVAGMISALTCRAASIRSRANLASRPKGRQAPYRSVAPVRPVGAPSTRGRPGSARRRQAVGARLSKPARAFMTAIGESCRRRGHHLPAVYVEGFGCRPLTGVRHAPAAGVRKPSLDETAMGSGWRCRGHYGDLAAAAQVVGCRGSGSF
jgi:hypothetical protein